MSQVKNVLFVCSGNAGRSIMAESILSKLGQGRFQAFSAGSHPTGRVNALAIEQLALRGYPVAELRSKSWRQFIDLGMPLDFVISVCDISAGQAQPEWPGNPILVHWNFRAPGAVEGSDQAIRQAFSTVCDQIENALKDFIAAPEHQSARAISMAAP
jgi:arsenate reductase